MKKNLAFIILFFYCFVYKAADSLKVHIVGSFNKGEIFKIHLLHKTYFIDVKCHSIQSWYFYLPIESSIQDGDLLPIIIEKKKGRKFYNTDLKCYYQSDRSYFILWKDKRQSKRYPFIELWSKRPIGSVTLDPAFWAKDFNKKFVPKIIPYDNKYEYFFTHLNEFFKKK